MSAANPSFGQLLRDPGLLIAFGFGSGLAPRAPGTFGTLAALPFYFALAAGGPWLYLAGVTVAGVVGVGLCGRAATTLGVHDHGGIVWDEFVGLWIALAPVLFLQPEWPLWLSMLAGFVLFRIFDILKPWPIGWLDRKVDGGLGIMLDDIVAGLEAALILAALIVVTAS